MKLQVEAVLCMSILHFNLPSTFILLFIDHILVLNYSFLYIFIYISN